MTWTRPQATTRIGAHTGNDSDAPTANCEVLLRAQWQRLRESVRVREREREHWQQLGDGALTTTQKRSTSTGNDPETDQKHWQRLNDSERDQKALATTRI